MKILVTGGAGFIGSHVVEVFLQAGHEVIVLDDLSTGKKENLPSHVHLEKMDIRSPNVKKFIKHEKPDIIDHHAAHIHVGRSVSDPQFDAQVNILGLLNLMEASLAAGSVKKVIFAATGGAMYGEQLTPFTESMPAQPLSPYGISKRSSELYLYYYFRQYNIPYISLRYANVYGPRQNPHGEAGVVSIFTEKLLKNVQPIINGDGKQTRDYVYVGDVAHANLLALNSDEVGEFNIGTSVETDVNEIHQKINSVLDINVPAQHGPQRPGEQRTSALNYSKAKNKLGWHPRVDLGHGIAHTVTYFKEKSQKSR